MLTADVLDFILKLKFLAASWISGIMIWIEESETEVSNETIETPSVLVMSVSDPTAVGSITRSIRGHSAVYV